MEKNTAQNAEIYDNNGQKVTTNKPKKSRKKIVGITGLIVLVVLAGILIVFEIQKNKQEKLVPTKIQAVAGAHNCSNNAYNSVAKEKPNSSQYHTSIVLLGYQASCLSSMQKYAQAVAKYKELLTYYKSKNDKNMVAVVTTEINSNQYLVMHPLKEYSSGKIGAPEAAFAKQLKEQSQ